MALITDFGLSQQEAKELHLNAVRKIMLCRGGFDACMETLPSSRQLFLTFMITDVLLATFRETYRLDTETIAMQRAYLTRLPALEHRLIRNGDVMPQALIQSIIRITALRRELSESHVDLDLQLSTLDRVGKVYCEVTIRTFFITKMQIILDGRHDIISWDFRGTGETLPFSCFATESARTLYWSEQQQLATNASDTAVGQAWATTSWLAAICENSTQASAVGDIIGTAYTARDMMQIVDALDEDGLLRYWGISYGTALGETVATTFPDRMHKVLLDAVVDPHEWFSGGSVSQVSDADALFESFLTQCLEAPDICPLAAHATSAHHLAADVYALLDGVKYEPLLFGTYGILTYANIKSVMLGMLYSRSEFETLAFFLDTLITKNETQYAQWLIGGNFYRR